MSVVGIGTARRPRRNRPRDGIQITAVVAPASADLVVGQSLSDTPGWSQFTDPTNYTTSAVGQSIASVIVNYIGDTVSAEAPFSDGDRNVFGITVADTAGNSREFTVIPRLVAHIAPVASAGLADQGFDQNSGLQFYDTAFDFTGAALIFSVTGPAGVSIDAGTGQLRIDTALTALQSATPVVVMATNSGGTAQSSFALTIAAPIVYSSQIIGLTDNPTYGSTAQIGVPLTGSILPLQGSEIIQHRWRDDTGLVSGATSQSYTPVATQRLASLRYAPLVNNAEILSPASVVRDAPPLAGSLPPVTATQGSGPVIVDVAAGFSGQDMSYSETVSWASISGSLLSIADEVRTDQVTVMATNTGGAASVVLTVTIEAPAAAQFNNNADGSVTFVSAGPAATAAFQNNTNGTVERIA